MNEQRYLLVVSGPSGVGKDTVVEYMIDHHEGLRESVSATTRQPRPGEVHGEDYYYLTKEEFLRRVANQEFVEYTEYAGNYYGTLKSEVEKCINSNISCVLVIEVEGAADIKQQYPECTTVFITAPSLEEHEHRLRSRGSECEEVIACRLAIAKKEMAMASTYDYVLVNDEAESCAEKLYDILKTRQAQPTP